MKKKTKKLLVLALIASSFMMASCGRKRASGTKCTGQCTAGLVVPTNNGNNGNHRY